MGDHIHMTAVLYRGSLRPATTGDGRDTRHSFSFGGHYDPTNTGFAALVAHNDERLAPGAGYAEHRHRDVEIVTYVVDGVLAHRGAGVTTDRLGPGDVMVTSAGSGVVHAETAPDEGPVRFVQAWLRPDRDGGEPTRAVARAIPAAGRLVPVVSGDGSAELGLGVAGATLWVGRLAPGQEAVLPGDAALHVFVATGSGRCADLALDEGDALRVPEPAALRFTAASGPGAGALLLVWSFRPTLTRGRAALPAAPR